MNQRTKRFDVESRLEIEQLIAEMVDWITDVHSRGDAVAAGFSEFVSSACSDDFVYRILEPGKDNQVFDKDEFRGFFLSSAEHVLSAQRMPGIPRIMTYEYDGDTDTEAVVVRNRVWALLILGNQPDARVGNLASQEWHFARRGASGRESRPWQFTAWDDWPYYIGLGSVNG